MAREALARCHFDPTTGTDLLKADLALEECVAACYHCLMTYANQRDHRQLDRHAIQPYLLQLTGGRANLQEPPVSVSEPIPTQSIVQADGDIEQEWLRQLRMRGLAQPSRVHEPVGSCQATPDFFFSSLSLAVYVDGNERERVARDADLVEDLENDGIFVVRFGNVEGWDDLFRGAGL